MTWGFKEVLHCRAVCQFFTSNLLAKSIPYSVLLRSYDCQDIIVKWTLTCCAVTSTAQLCNALWTAIGLAGAPLGVVNATQYEIAGQRDLFTLVKFPSSHRSVMELGIWLESWFSSLESLSSTVSSLMLPFFFSCVEIALKKNATLRIPLIKENSMHQNLKMHRQIFPDRSVKRWSQILTWNSLVACIAFLTYGTPRLWQRSVFHITNTLGTDNTTSPTYYRSQVT